MSRAKQSTAERAVRGVLGGWVSGTKFISYTGPDISCDGSVVGVVHIHIAAESVRKMLADERKAAKKGAKR